MNIACELNETLWVGKGRKYECITGQNGRNVALCEGCIHCIAKIEAETFRGNLPGRLTSWAHMQAILYEWLFTCLMI